MSASAKVCEQILFSKRGCSLKLNILSVMNSSAKNNSDVSVMLAMGNCKNNLIEINREYKKYSPTASSDALYVSVLEFRL
ncbi:hypothetical protein AO726_06145 [Pseudomonas sp. TTU2014-080ASC]|nr:hypothetical protein AO726_06145 [Pseudomonas sp. TTU2014-080ASC]